MPNIAESVENMPNIAEVAEKLPNNIKVAEKLLNVIDVAEKVSNVDETIEKLPKDAIGRLTSAELSFLYEILGLFDRHEWISNSDVRDVTGKSDGSVKRFMRNLKEKNVLESRGKLRIDNIDCQRTIN